MLCFNFFPTVQLRRLYFQSWKEGSQTALDTGYNPCKLFVPHNFTVAYLYCYKILLLETTYYQYFYVNVSWQLCTDTCLNKQLFINHRYLEQYPYFVEVQWSYGQCFFTSGSSSPGLSPGWRHYVVLLGKTLYSHSAFLSKWILTGLMGVFHAISRLMKQAG